MIVADTNLLVYLYVRSEQTGRAESTLARDPVWAAPLLWRSVFRNSLIGLVRRRALGLEEAVRIARDAELLMAGQEYAIVTHRALELTMRSGCSAYDCEFVALAQDLGVKLVTVDQQLLAAFPSIAVPLGTFAAAKRHVAT